MEETGLVAARIAADEQFSTIPAGSAIAPAPPPPVVITGLGAEVDLAVSRSPKLSKTLLALQKSGWSMEFATKEQGTLCDKAARKLFVASEAQGNLNRILSDLANRAGYALYREDPYASPEGLTKEEYVLKNVFRKLKAEGERIMTCLEIRNDLKARSGESIEISFTQVKEYERFLKEFPDRKDRERIRGKIGAYAGDNEHPAALPSSTYREYYSKAYAELYDAAPREKESPNQG